MCFFPATIIEVAAKAPCVVEPAGQLKGRSRAPRSVSFADDQVEIIQVLVFQEAEIEKAPWERPSSLCVEEAPWASQTPPKSNILATPLISSRLYARRRAARCNDGTTSAKEQ
mmetsp:Transcript_55231/g.129612  ORF Transcript_55231/g.129612 Transcript_55231/m.129612 type:complete len:113 (+) Transcript_55231:120-458(+)